MTDDVNARQVEAIGRWLRVFHPNEGYAVELRALNVLGRKAVCEVFADSGALARRAAELDAAGASGVYFTLNPLRPDLVGSRASCRAEDVAERRWLPVDVDPWRPKDTSSTEAELRAAWAVLDRCRGILDGAGLTGAVVGCSGNGWHLCYPLVLPNDEDSRALVRAVLRGLHERCSDALTAEEEALLKEGKPLLTPKARVDTSTFDAPRIWKLYGTKARKGESTAERPHRYARLVEPVVRCAGHNETHTPAATHNGGGGGS